MMTTVGVPEALHNQVGAAFIAGFSIGTHFPISTGHAVLNTETSHNLHTTVEAVVMALETLGIGMEEDYQEDDVPEGIDVDLPDPPAPKGYLN